MREPDYTCPLINQAQKDLDAATDEIIDVMNNQLEKIRDANSELRNWGEHWKKRAEELEKDLDAAERKISELEDENAELASELSNLQRGVAA